MLTLGVLPWMCRGIAHDVAIRAQRRGGRPTMAGLRICTASPMLVVMIVFGVSGAIGSILIGVLGFSLLDAWRGPWLPFTVLLVPIVVAFFVVIDVLLIWAGLAVLMIPAFGFGLWAVMIDPAPGIFRAAGARPVEPWVRAR